MTPEGWETNEEVWLPQLTRQVVSRSSLRDGEPTELIRLLELRMCSWEPKAIKMARVYKAEYCWWICLRVAERILCSSGTQMLPSFILLLSSLVSSLLLHIVLHSARDVWITLFSPPKGTCILAHVHSLLDLCSSYQSTLCLSHSPDFLDQFQASVSVSCFSQ